MKYLRNTVSVSPAGDGTLVTFIIDFHIKFGPVGALMAKLAVQPQMRKTMALSLPGLKHHIETGEVVSAVAEVSQRPLAAVA